jgi:hypothetical protein
MRRWIWITVALAGLLGSLATAVRGEQPKSSTPAEPAPVARPSWTPVPRTPLLVTPPEPMVPMAAESERSVAVEEATEPPPATLEEARDRMDAAFYASATDPGPARELERMLAREVPGWLPAGSQLRALDCRAGVCRIETAHANIAAYQQFVERSFGPHGEPLPFGGVFTGALAAPVAGQPLLTFAYVSAPGGVLPGEPAHSPR